VEAIYYDNAGRIGNLHHFEVSPGRDDTLRLRYRDRRVTSSTAWPGPKACRDALTSEGAPHVDAPYGCLTCHSGSK
jgi:hypothetical protein